MSPFRDAPPVELGPFEVGLAEAARRALPGLPRGGRVMTARPAGRPSHVIGALGSAGLVAVLAAALATWATVRFGPPAPIAPIADASDGAVGARGAEMFIALAVLASGASLAAVLRAIDRISELATSPGALVGRRARRILARFSRLARAAEADATRFGRRRAGALRRAIEAAAAPEIAPWIPPDVIGRAELLLARATAALGGPAWHRDAARRREVRGLVIAAVAKLDDARPAAADLAAIDGAPHPTAERPVRVRVKPERRRARFAVEPAPIDASSQVDDEELFFASRPARVARRG